MIDVQAQCYFIIAYDTDGAGTPALVAAPFGVVPASLMAVVPLAQWRLELADQPAPGYFFFGSEFGDDFGASRAARLVPTFESPNPREVTISRVDGTGALLPYAGPPTNVAACMFGRVQLPVGLVF